MTNSKWSLWFTVFVCALVFLDADAHAGERYAERLVLPITLGTSSNGEPRFMNQPAIGDINKDGLNDVVFGASQPVAVFEEGGPLVILLNDGAGSFFDGTAEIIDGPNPVNFGRQYIIADFNKDGQNDIFVDDHGTEAIWPTPGARNGLLLSGMDGKLRDVTETNLPNIKDFSHGSTAADVDGDGDIDIWVNNAGVGEARSYLMLNNGKGKFTIVADLGIPNDDIWGSEIVGTNGRLPEVLVGRMPFWSQFIDVENDGDPDLYLGRMSDVNSTSTWLLLNDGTGRFTDAGRDAIPTRLFGGMGLAQNSAVIDINGDGFDDLMLLEGPHPGDTICPDNKPVATVIVLLISNGDGSFRDETFLRTPQSEDCRGDLTMLDDFDILEIDGDGAKDIMITAYPHNEFLLNNGFGFFSKLPIDWVDIDPPMGLRVIPVDVDGDGDSDFVENNEQADETSLIKATRTATVTTTDPSSVTSTSASSGGNVTADGGATVTAKGVCWSTSVNPTISNSKTSDGTGTGSFTSSITGLTAGTTYHVRAYATNSAGTGYGGDISFITSLPSCSECSVSPVVLTNVTFNSACECSDNTSITIGTGVTIKSGANVIFKAPTVTIQSGFHAEEGAVVNIKQQ